MSGDMGSTISGRRMGWIGRGARESPLLSYPLSSPAHQNTFLVVLDKISNIPIDKFIEAFDLLDNGVSTLCKFESGKNTTPFCPLLWADNLKPAKAKLDCSAKQSLISNQL